MSLLLIAQFAVNHAYSHTQQITVASDNRHSKRRAQHVPAPTNSAHHWLIHCLSKPRRRTCGWNAKRVKGDAKKSPMANPVADIRLVGCVVVRPIKEKVPTSSNAIGRILPPLTKRMRRFDISSAIPGVVVKTVDPKASTWLHCDRCISCSWSRVMSSHLRIKRRWGYDIMSVKDSKSTKEFSFFSSFFILCKTAW